MIRLHRLRGEQIYLNADLIESVEVTPDTVVTLIDGRKLVVVESPSDVVDLVREFRASILAAAAETFRDAPADLVSLPLPDD